MKQKGIELGSLISKPLSDDQRNIIIQIINNKKAKPGEIYRCYENKKVSWGSMWRLLKHETNSFTKTQINDEVINFYFKKYLAEMDQKQCQEEPEQNCSGFLGSYFWEKLTNQKNNDMTVRGKYNYEMVSRWSKKLPGNNIFNLKILFVPININN